MNIEFIFEAWSHFQSQVGDLGTPQAEDDYQKIIGLMNTLIDTKNIADEPWAGLFNYLAVLANAWEMEHDEALKNIEATPQSVLALLMEEHGLTQQQLAQEGIVDQGNLSNILRGKRGMSKSLAKRLANRSHVSVEVFL